VRLVPEEDRQVFRADIVQSSMTLDSNSPSFMTCSTQRLGRHVIVSYTPPTNVPQPVQDVDDFVMDGKRPGDLGPVLAIPVSFCSAPLYKLRVSDASSSILKVFMQNLAYRILNDLLNQCAWL